MVIAGGVLEIRDLLALIADLVGPIRLWPATPRPVGCESAVGRRIIKAISSVPACRPRHNEGAIVTPGRDGDRVLIGTAGILVNDQRLIGICARATISPVDRPRLKGHAIVAEMQPIQVASAVAVSPQYEGRAWALLRMLLSMYALLE